VDNEGETVQGRVLVHIMMRLDVEGPIRRPERGGSEWEQIKILLEGD
jgi:hypothetical protein